MAPKSITIGGQEIKVEETPDIGNKTISVTLGIRLYPYLFMLFESNEMPPAGKLHDGMIEQIVRKEFNSPDVIKSIEDCPINRIGIWRNLYNRGKFGKITYYSFRYSLTGEPMNARMSAVLTHDMMRATVRSRGINDPRFPE